MSKKQCIHVKDIQRKEKLTDSGVQIWDKFYINMTPGQYIITIQDRNGNPWVTKNTAIQVKKRILQNESTIHDIKKIISRKPQTNEEKAIMKCLKDILVENKVSFKIKDKK